VITNSDRIRFARDPCPGDSFISGSLSCHIHGGECDFCRLNELSKYRDKIALDDGVIGLYQYARVCVCVCVRVKEKCICRLSNFRDTCRKTTYKALKLPSKLAICKRCWKCNRLFDLIISARKGLRRAQTANERHLRGGKSSISAGDARRPLIKKGEVGICRRAQCQMLRDLECFLPNTRSKPCPQLIALGISSPTGRACHEIL
jgi:hypothetical protein